MPTFLHTADWHLGKRLHDFWLIDEQREALERLLDVVDTERPDAVLLAGDVFDAPVPPVRALRLWEWAAERIVARRGVPLVVIPGNHDHAERLAMNARMARTAGLHVLNQLASVDRPVRVAGVDLFGVPFHKPAHVRSWRNAVEGGAPETTEDASDPLGDFDYHAAMAALLDRARAERTPGVPAIVLAHAFVEGGGEESDAEDALMVGGAGGVRPDCFHGFDYVALGHLHTARTLAGPAPLRYAGGLFPYAFDEPGDKSVTLIDVPASAGAGGAGLEIRQAPLPVRRKVRMVSGVSFDEAIARGEAARRAKRAREAREEHEAQPDAAPADVHEDPDDYLWITVTDRQPIDNAVRRLREVHPHALLEQSAIAVQDEATPLAGNTRTMRVDDAFLNFYLHVFGSDPTEIEREVLNEVLAQDDAPGDELDEGEPKHREDVRGRSDGDGETSP